MILNSVKRRKDGLSQDLFACSKKVKYRQNLIFLAISEKSMMNKITFLFANPSLHALPRGGGVVL